MMGYIRRMMAVLLVSLPAGMVHAASIGINGTIDFVEFDNGGATYSGVGTGASVSGFIDDVTFGGELTVNGVTTPFGCCIAAGGLAVSNDFMLDGQIAGLLNTIAGTSLFSAGEMVDLIEIEGDAATATRGRIEIGVSYIFPGTTFSDASLSNYPFDPAALKFAVFFIFEEDVGGNNLYSVLGALQPVPVPAAAWLFASGLLGLIGVARRRQ